MHDDAVSGLKRKLLAAKRALGSWNKLAEAIARAGEYEKRSTIDRRTLERLCDDDEFASVRLTVAQIIALDRFFSLHGLGWLLSREQSLIDAVAEASDINFMVGAQSMKDLDDEYVAGCDLRAVTHLHSTRLNRTPANILDVTSLKNWKALEGRTRNAANIFVASPISSPASEAALCSMAGIEVGKHCQIRELPFAIIGRKSDAGVKSNFIRTRQDAARINTAVAGMIESDKRALFIGETFFLCDDDTDYGVLICQRDWQSGQVQIVLCGLSGPGTEFLARIVASGGPMIRLPLVTGSEARPPILIAAYQFAVMREKKEQGRGRAKRRVVGSKSIYGPALIGFESGAWQIRKDIEEGDSARLRHPGLVRQLASNG